ncbi:HoxN/HupN/NixA family nickel/cobalt transporter [Acidisoma sp. 7E03]
MSTVPSTATHARLRPRILGIYGFLLLFNLAAWIWAAVVFRGNPLLLGTALLAWSFGLRHAVDADHIAAIDNVTRKLMQDGRRPVTVGLFFALGHSAVVVLVAAAIAATAAAMEHRFEGWKAYGGVISTSVSALFLFLIAAMNVVILRSLWRTFRLLRRGGKADPLALDLLGGARGPLAWLFRPLFRLVSGPLWMLPLGFLFGLGFDTATEVSLLGVSATQAAHGVPIAAIMVFPVLFAAGMSLVDTTDGILMLGAYDWAFVRPVRKLYYNLTITLVSVLVAVLVGGIETLGLVADQFGLDHGVWALVGRLNDNFNDIGFAIIGIFILSWALSFVIYRLRGYDRLDLA